jgi:hypothetical protein
MPELLTTMGISAFPVQIERQICAFRRASNRDYSYGYSESLLYHIRNAFAHGRIAIETVDSEQFILLEDTSRRRITARMIISYHTLQNWKKIIELGPKMTDEAVSEQLLGYE